MRETRCGIHATFATKNSLDKVYITCLYPQRRLCLFGESWSWVEVSHTLDIWGNVSLLELNKRLEVTSVWPAGYEHDEEDEGSSRHSSVKFPATGTLEHEVGAICGDDRLNLVLGRLRILI